MSIGAVSNHAVLRPVARVAKAEVDNDVEGGVRTVLDVFLPIGTGIVADQVMKGALKSGRGKAIVLSFAAAAITHAVAETTVQVIKNKSDNLPWDNRLVTRALRGGQTGLFIAAGCMAGPYIQGRVASRFTKLPPVLLVGISNATAAVTGQVVRLSANPDTWKNGTNAGLKRIAVTSGVTACTAMLAGSGIRGLAMIPAVNRIFQKLPYPFSG
ncbi:MAG: hypothetical protein H7338_17150 [Candidatus Sericytochromatia bacterium]|nr:hypothetical protein [Candidatus Sericytochromatia bacterium]